MFSYNGTINGKYYWIKNGGGQAIWYYPEFKIWAIGQENNLGTLTKDMFSAFRSICPTSDYWKYPSFSLSTWSWAWIYAHTDFKLSCIGRYSALNS